MLTVAYVVANRSIPHPDASGFTVLDYARAHGTTVKASALLLFSSAAPLAIPAAVLYRRLRALGITAPGSAITLVGGWDQWRWMAWRAAGSASASPVRWRHT